MKKHLVMAWRNLWRNRKRTNITLASIVFAVVIATFMRGLQLGSYDKMLSDVITSSTGHLAIMDQLYWDDKTLINSMEFSSVLEQELRGDDEIDFWAPEITGGCLASSGPHTRGVLVQGVDPAVKDQQMKLKEKIIAGEYLEDDDEAVLIGKDLAQFLRMEVGDTLILFGQGYQGVTAAAKYPVKGIFDHPMSDFNRRLTILPLAAAQYLFYMEGRVTNINLILQDPKDYEEIQTRYEAQIDTTLLEVNDWKSMNKELLSGIESDNFFGKLMIGILYMVIAFGIFGTILMMTMERKKEFSIMIAIGMQRAQLIGLVIIESIYMAAIGAVVGLIISFPVVYFYANNPIEITGDTAETYRQLNMEPILAISTNANYMVMQFIIVMLISLLASIIPLRNINAFNIVDIIRGKQ
jgi:ABC-type lipoprotein release transport system permease subunit